MAAESKTEQLKLAIVVGTLPNIDEIDQFRVLADSYQVCVVSSESICNYLNETSRFNNLQCYALPDHDENPSYIPGLESVLKGFDIVVLKERMGLYAFQAVKAKWKHKFRLLIWVDNLTTLPAEDIDQMRTIRHETTNAADAFIVQTKAARNALLVEGIENQRIFDVSCFVDAHISRTKKERAKALEALKIAESCFVIGHVGPIEWEEGILDLGAAVKLACQEKPSLKDKIKLVFCGIGSFAPQLKQAFVALGIDHMVIFVAPTRDAFATIYTGIDCIYFNSIPSRDRVDGDPSRILNAMANQIPILATRSPVIEEYCGKNRIDFCSDSVSSLVEAMDKMLNAKSIVNANVEKAKKEVDTRYTREKVLATFDKTFKNILATEVIVDGNNIDHQVMNIESLVSSKQYLKAIDIIESVFKQPEIPTHHKSNLYRLVGDCFAKLSDNEGAKNAYIKAIELDAYSPKSYIGLGTVSLVKQNHDIAVLHFQKAVSLAPQDEMANLGLGLSFQGLDELKEANKWVVKSLEINFENTAALYTLVRIAYELEAYIDAENFVQKYVDVHPFDQNMIYTLAGVKFKLGKFKEVIDLASEIVKIDPMDAKAHGLLKQAQKALDGRRPTQKNA